jgi:hypothetical protein
MLLPTSIVVINLEGFWVSRARILARKVSFFFSSSMCILFAETKEISMPEKNADKRIDTIMMTISVIIIFSRDFQTSSGIFS